MKGMQRTEQEDAEVEDRVEPPEKTPHISVPRSLPFERSKPPEDVTHPPIPDVPGSQPFTVDEPSEPCLLDHRLKSPLYEVRYPKLISTPVSYHLGQREIEKNIKRTFSSKPEENCRTLEDFLPKNPRRRDYANVFATLL
ncbi:hypothetical protein SK128_016559, partial [Halocaridina rubra]